MTTTATPTTDEQVRESFIKLIGRKLRAGRARTARFFGRIWRKTKSGGRTAGANAVRWGKAGGHGFVYGLTGGLALLGKGLHLGARLIGGAINFVLVGIALVATLLLALVAVIVNAVVFAVQYLVYGLVKLVHVLALVLCSPWIAFRHGKAPLKEDWEILFTGLKPRNWHIINPGALAAQTLRERDAKEKAKATAKTQATRNGQAAAKGRPTPKQRTRRPAKLHPEPAVV